MDNELVQRIIDLRESRDWSQKDLAEKINLSKVTMNKIEHGVRKVTSSELKQLAEVFGVSTDYLLGTKQSSKEHYYDLTDKDRQDIGKEVERVLSGLTSSDEVNYYGEPMSDDDKQKMRIAMQAALEAAQVEARKKFTPKKYRHDDSLEK